MAEEQPINVAQAAAEIGNLMRMFKGVQDASTIVALLAQSDNQLAELKRAITNAKTQLTRAQNEVEDAKAEAGRIRDEANFALQAAQAERERTLTDAREQADVTMAEAVARRNAIEAEVAAEHRTLDGLRQQAGLVRGELARLEDARKAVLVALSGAAAAPVDVEPSPTPATP